MSDAVKAEAIRAVVALVRGTRAGSLATVMEGQPFASLVTPASAPDGSLLMLLSGLSPHTRHLRAEPRCSLMLMGTARSANPQTAPRISLAGRAEPEPEPALKARWVALHPYAAFYADLGDFVLWRFRPASGQFVGGFASAHRFQADQLAPDPAAVTAIAAAEPRILAHCNDDHAVAMDAIAHARGATGQGWCMIACDVDGCDLAHDERTVRIDWPAPVDGPEGLRAALIQLTDAARTRTTTGPAPVLPVKDP